MKLLTSQQDFDSARSKDLMKLECCECGKEFHKQKSQVLSSLKNRAGKFCSRACGFNNKRTGRNVNCGNCDKRLYVPLHEILSNKNHFCSHSCSATFNNALTPKTQPQGSCVRCSKTISTSRKFCPECFQIDKEEGKNKTRLKYKTKEYKDRKYAVMKKSIMNYYKRTKLKMIEYKGGKCLCCDYSACPAALEFHHIDPTKKDFALSGRSISFEKAKPELDKCVLLCCRCHREFHAGLIALPMANSNRPR